MTSSVRAYTCPSCGGSLAIRSGALRAECGSCRTPCAVVDPDARLLAGPRVRLEPRIDASGAVALVRAALSSWPVDEHAADRALFRRPELVYVPFCEVRSLQAGTVVRRGTPRSVRGGTVDYSTGVRRFLDDDGREISEGEYYRRRDFVPLEAQVMLRDVRTILATAGPDEWELGRIGIAEMLDDPSVLLAPFDAAKVSADATVLTPRIGPKEILATDARFLPDTEGTRVEHMAVRVRWIYHPLYVVRWDLGRHPYTFVVGAVDGEIVHGRAPETARRGRVVALAAAVAIGLPLGSAIAVVSDAWGRGADAQLLRIALRIWPAWLFFLFLLVSFLAVVWSEFRFRGEVVFGAGGPSVRRLARPGTTAIERFANRVGRMLDDSVRPRE